MNPILLTALIAFSAVASAGLPTSGLPSGSTDIAVHVSNETLDKTQIGKALTGAFTGEIDANKVVIALKNELGFELDEDFRDLTVVAKAGDEKSFVALVRGKFNKARIEAFAATNKVPNHNVKGLKAWDARALGDAIAKAAGTESSKENPNMTVELVIVDGNTVVVAEASNIERAVAAATSNTPWKHAGLSTADASVKNGWLLVSANVAAIEEAEAAKRKSVATDPPEAKTALAKRSGVKAVILALGENATDVTLRVHADFVDEAAAKKNISQAKGMLGFGSMLTMPADGDSAEAAANKATGSDLIRRITITQNGAAGDATLDYPIQKLAQSIVRAAEARREKSAGKGK
jgi:hypothetical protein